MRLAAERYGLMDAVLAGSHDAIAVCRLIRGLQQSDLVPKCSVRTLTPESWATFLIVYTMVC